MKVPRRIIYQMDFQIKAAEKRAAKILAHIKELKAARAEMEPLE